MVPAAARRATIGVVGCPLVRETKMRLAALCAVLAATLLPPAARAAPSGEAIALEGIPGVVPACASCHGAHGEGGGEGLYPRLAGLPAAYLRRELDAVPRRHAREPADDAHGKGADRCGHRCGGGVLQRADRAVPVTATGRRERARARAGLGHRRRLGERRSAVPGLPWTVPARRRARHAGAGGTVAAVPRLRNSRATGRARVRAIRSASCAASRGG